MDDVSGFKLDLTRSMTKLTVNLSRLTVSKKRLKIEEKSCVVLHAHNGAIARIFIL